MGIPLIPAGTQSHRQQGQDEAHGGVWTEAFLKSAASHSLSVQDLDAVVRGFIATNRGHKNRHRHNYYSPLQWTL